MAYETRFYNAGQRICEKLAYDNPLLDPKNSNLIAYFHLDAPEKNFFTVPRELEMQNGARVAAMFDRSIIEKYGKRGVVQVDKNLDPASIDEDSPLAATDADAKRKAEKSWVAFLKDKAQEWLDHCATVHQAGGNAKPASGFHKFALEYLGIKDPGDALGNVVEAKANTSEMDEMRKKIEALTKLVEGKK